MKHSLLKALKSTILSGLVLAVLLLTSTCVDAQVSISKPSRTDTICAGDTVKAYISSATVSGTTYTWSVVFGDAGSFTAVNDTVWLYPTTNYTFYRVVRDSSGVKDSTDLGVDLYSVPTVVLTTSKDTVCINDSILLKGSNANSYTYWNSRGMLGSGDSLKIAANPYDSVWVVGTHAKGCKNSSAKKLLPSSSSSTVGITVSSDTVCIGEQITLKGSGAISYSYFKGAIPSGGGDSANVVITKSDSVSVVGIDANGCKTTAFKKVVGKAIPVVGFKVYVQGFISDDEFACSGQDFTLKATPGYSSYIWSSTSQIIGSKTDSTIIGQSLIAANYNLTVTNALGCQLSTRFLMRVANQPTKFAAINLIGGNSDTVLCGGEVRRALATNGAHFLWSPASAIDSGTVTSKKIRLKPANDETVFLSGISLGCITKDTIILRVSQLPTLTFVSQTSTVAKPLCEGDGDTIKVSSNSSKILWNTVVSSRTTKTVAFKKTTTFDIIAFNDLDCETKLTVTSYVDTTCGFRISTEEFKQQDLNAFYNADNEKMVLSTSTELGNANVVVYNLSGRQVLNTSVELVPNTRMEFDFSPLSNGVYLFKVFNSESNYTRKFIKH